MIATIYSISTGVIRGVIDTPDIETILLNIRPGDAVIEGRIDPATHYLTPAGPMAYPPRPGDWAVWNGTGWTDPRSIAERAADLDAARNAANLTKAELLAGLLDLGMISATDATAAARDNAIPAAFAAGMESWPALDRATAKIEWAANARINRNQAVIVAAVAELDLDPVALDRLFGIVET